MAHFPPSPSRSPLRLSSSRPPSPFSNPPSPNGLTAAAVLHTLALRGELQGAIRDANDALRGGRTRDALEGYTKAAAAAAEHLKMAEERMKEGRRSGEAEAFEHWQCRKRWRQQEAMMQQPAGGDGALMKEGLESAEKEELGSEQENRAGTQRADSPFSLPSSSSPPRPPSPGAEPAASNRSSLAKMRREWSQLNLSVSLQLLDCLRMQGTCLGILQNGEQAKVCLASVLVTISDIEAEYATTKAKTIPTTNSNDDAAAVDDEEKAAAAAAGAAGRELCGKRAEALAAMGQLRGSLDGDFTGAVEHLEKALAHAKRSGSARIEASVRSNLAAAMVQAGESPQQPQPPKPELELMQGGGRQQEGAYEHMERALELRQREAAEAAAAAAPGLVGGGGGGGGRGDDAQHLTRTQLNLAALKHEQGRRREAAGLFKKALISALPPMMSPLSPPLTTRTTESESNTPATSSATTTCSTKQQQAVDVPAAVNALLNLSNIFGDLASSPNHEEEQRQEEGEKQQVQRERGQGQGQGQAEEERRQQRVEDCRAARKNRVALARVMDERLKRTPNATCPICLDAFEDLEEEEEKEERGNKEEGGDLRRRNGGDGNSCGGKDEEEKEGALLSMRQVRILKCLHWLHADCYAEMRRGACPLCMV